MEKDYGYIDTRSEKDNGFVTAEKDFGVIDGGSLI